MTQAERLLTEAKKDPDALFEYICGLAVCGTEIRRVYFSTLENQVSIHDGEKCHDFPVTHRQRSGLVKLCKEIAYPQLWGHLTAFTFA